MLAADTALIGQQEAAASAAEEGKWAQMAGWANLTLAARPSVLPPPPAPSKPADFRPAGSSCLEGVKASIVGHSVATNAAVRRRARAALRRMLLDGREVAAELTADPANPQRVCLLLRPLAASRTQAAIAAKLAGRAAARQRAVLEAALQASACRARARQALLSSERAALLGAFSSKGCGPQPNPLTALQRVLRSGLELQRAQLPAENGQRCETAAVALRRHLAQGVLTQHKELRKVWREKK